MVDLCTAIRLLLLFRLGVSTLLRDPFRFCFLGGDPIRFVGRLLGQPFLLGRCFGRCLGFGLCGNQPVSTDAVTTSRRRPENFTPSSRRAEHPKFDFPAGPHDACGVRLLFFELLECTRGLLTFFLRFRFGRSGGLRLPLGLLFGASRLGRLRLSLGLARRRLLGQACVEINQ